jgi:predicted peroxiredoxin
LPFLNYTSQGIKMKKIFLTLLLLLVSLEAKEYKAVFDCSSSDAHYIKTRMWLIDKTISMIEEKGDNARFVLTLNGGCVPMVSKYFLDIVPDEDISNIKKAQDHLKTIATKKNVKVIACAMSLKRNLIKQKDVLDFVSVSPNSYIDTIGYQNDGYALMTFK